VREKALDWGVVVRVEKAAGYRLAIISHPRCVLTCYLLQECSTLSLECSPIERLLPPRFLRGEKVAKPDEGGIERGTNTFCASVI
jgi:hypothetical protein